MESKKIQNLWLKLFFFAYIAQQYVFALFGQNFLVQSETDASNSVEKVVVFEYAVYEC